MPIKSASAAVLALALLGQAQASCILANLGGTGSKLVYSESGRVAGWSERSKLEAVK